MKRVHGLKLSFATWMATTAAVVMGFFLTSCPRQSQPISQAEYSTNIIGRWQGMVGDSRETMSIDKDGTFVCELQPTGFISTMIFPRATGTVRGTWKIVGATITLNIASTKNEALRNKITASTIVSFLNNELVLKADRGDTARFRRVQRL